MIVILDTNVLVSALRSQYGASYAVLQALDQDRFEIALTLPLYLEYRDVLGRDSMVPPELTQNDVIDFCQGLAEMAHLHDVHYLWRPWVHDPKDDLVLEAALAASARQVVTHNVKDFVGKGIEDGLGVQIVTPASFLKILGGD